MFQYHLSYNEHGFQETMELEGHLEALLLEALHLLLTHSVVLPAGRTPPPHNVTRRKWETLINHSANLMCVRL